MIRSLFLFVILSPIMMFGQDANLILQKSRQAFGGEAWNHVNYVRMHHIGHQQWLEQSENPDGPFITSYFDVEEIHAVKEMKLYQKAETKMSQSKEPVMVVYVQNDTLGYMAFGERKMAMPYSYQQENIRWINYAPEHLLGQAQKSGARLEKVVDLEGVNHYQLYFTNRATGYRLFINTRTFLLSEAQVETYAPYEFFFSLWGKFTTRVQYSLYGLNKRNIVYPLQWDVYRAGHLWKKITINDIEFTETTDEKVFAIPEEVKEMPVTKQKVNDVRLPVANVVEVAKGIFVIPGNWFTGWVEQEDGILVMEAPISSGYSRQLVEEIKKRYPSTKIKGVVVTSDAWPHLAGVREYMAMKIPVYTNRLNKPLLDRIAVVDHSPAPDQQQLKKVKPDYRLINEPLLIDDTKNPVQIIPIEGEGGERMVAVYSPKQKVLYASDLVQQMRDKSFFFIEYLAEVKAVVDKHKLDVETVYAMHTRPLAWKEIEETLEKNKF